MLDGIGLPSPLLATKHQLFLGDQSFIEQHALLKDDVELREVSKTQRRALVQPLAYFTDTYADRNEAMAQAYQSGVYSMAEIALAFGVHCMTVSRAVRAAEAKAVLAQDGG